MTTKCRTFVDVFSQHSEVTGSSIVLIIKLSDGEIVKGMIDCGSFQELQYQEENSKLIIEPKCLDFVCITHAHMDHASRVPLLVNKGYEKKIFCTKGTAEFLPYALHDNLKIMRDKCRRKNERVLYFTEDVNKTLQLIEKKEYQETFSVHEKIKITFLKNGHLLGASLILLQIEDEEKINLLFTGDYNDKNVFFEVESIPQWIKKLPMTIITESTYGNKTTIECLEENGGNSFNQNIIEASKQNKSILIPAFALERSQEVLYRIRCLQEQSYLDDYSIYLDGSLAIVYTEILKLGRIENLKVQDFLPKNFAYVVNSVMRGGIVNSKGNKIIVTTSGMGQYGPAQIYIPEFITKQNALIQFTGYCAEGTYGRKLREESLYHDTVKFTAEFSAHAKKEVLLNLINEFEDKKSVLINHGASDVKEKFKMYLEENTDTKNIKILQKKVGYRIGAYGIIKELNTVF